MQLPYDHDHDGPGKKKSVELELYYVDHDIVLKFQSIWWSIILLYGN